MKKTLFNIILKNNIEKKMIIDNNILIKVNNDDIINGTFIIPETITSIGDSAFRGCADLTSIIIPNNVTSIGNYAFAWCSSLTSIMIGNGVISIGEYVFYDCESLTSVTFVDNSQLESIGYDAFALTGLVAINIPDSVTSIGIAAFEYCSSLESITFSENSKLKSIGNYAFYYCSKLASVTIPDGVTSIGVQAFEKCRSLTSITIPASVTSIGKDAFDDCSNLKSKKTNYKAFALHDGELRCRNKIYNENKVNLVRGDLRLCKNGIHYCTNLFEIFNFYFGEIDKDIAIYEIDVGGQVLTDEYSSKCCTNSCILKRRLYREDVIKILNGEEV